MEPGRTAFPGCFPRRNRIIAGLAKLVVVVEAGFKSGALNTANWAQQMGRDVAAVPGQIDDPRAAGSNQLIRDGAIVLADVDDLLMVCGLSTFTHSGISGGDRTASSDSADLGPEDRAILLTLGPRPIKLEEIAFASSLSLRQVGDSLLRLEIRGRVEATPSGYLRRQALSDHQANSVAEVLG
jgi:DNA processing protein